MIPDNFIYLQKKKSLIKLNQKKRVPNWTSCLTDILNQIDRSKKLAWKKYSLNPDLSSMYVQSDLYFCWWIFEYRTRAIITRGLYIFYPIFKTICLFSRRFFQKILALCTVRIQERFLIKSELYIRTVYFFRQENMLPHFHIKAIMKPKIWYEK